MDEATARQQSVARHYDGDFFTFEEQRLSTLNQTEYAITVRYLTRYIPPGSIVADIGVGVGHYAHVLAEHGCRLWMADISQRLLDAATTRLRAGGHADALLGAANGSATDLQQLSDKSCDAVLLLGPLYHLVTLAERQQAIREAARILRPGGLLFAAGVSRLAFLRDSFQSRPESGRARYAVRRALYESGQFGQDSFLNYSHLTTVAEFRQLFAETFQEEVLVGVESFVSPNRELMARLPADDAQAWLDLVELTGTTPEGIGQSDHFLYIGRAPRQDKSTAEPPRQPDDAGSDDAPAAPTDQECRSGDDLRRIEHRDHAPVRVTRPPGPCPTSVTRRFGS